MICSKHKYLACQSIVETHVKIKYCQQVLVIIVSNNGEHVSIPTFIPSKKKGHIINSYDSYWTCITIGPSSLLKRSPTIKEKGKQCPTKDLIPWKNKDTQIGFSLWSCNNYHTLSITNLEFNLSWKGFLT